MKPLYILFLGTVLSLTNMAAYAQDDHAGHHHHGRNEVGINVGGLYAIDDKEWGSAIHFHYFRSLGDHSPWSIGGFFEQSLFLDNHFSLGAGAKFDAFKKLQIGVFPGVTFSKHGHDHSDDEGIEEHEEEKKTNSKFSIHGELTYILFEWKGFHVGPAFDYSWSKGDSHFMLGVHSAYSF